MKYETILQKVYELNNDGKINSDKYQKLIGLLKNEVIKEEAPKTTSKSQLNAILKMLERSQSSPVLTKAPIQNGVQTFTDSYILFQFTNDCIIESLPQLENGMVYPDVSRIVETVFYNCYESDNFIVGDLKKEIKTIKKAEPIILTLDAKNNIKIALSTKKLQEFLTIMKLKNNEIINFKYNQKTKEGFSLSPLGIIKENKKGIIMPLRIN